jgi:Cys-tRNA(Pro)/Cys-tRNA(Cys) deacylase
MSIPTQDQAENLTGLLAGGISPLAVINKGFQTVIDLPAQNLDGIIISAGERGLQIKIHPDDLAKLVNARFLEIST